MPTTFNRELQVRSTSDLGVLWGQCPRSTPIQYSFNYLCFAQPFFLAMGEHLVGRAAGSYTFGGEPTKR